MIQLTATGQAARMGLLISYRVAYLPSRQRGGHGTKLIGMES